MICDLDVVKIDFQLFKYDNFFGVFGLKFLKVFIYIYELEYV